MTDAAVLALPDLAARAAAIAALGSAAALHARDKTATALDLTALTRRFLALAQPAEATVVVNGRGDVAAALGAHGIQLGAPDPAPRDLRRGLGDWHGRIGVSVHSVTEAGRAIAEGADYLLAGAVYPTSTHPGVAPIGLNGLAAIVALGRPTIAIGGVTPARIAEVRSTGAYGVAAITALWHAEDPYQAACWLVAPWLEEE